MTNIVSRWRISDPPDSDVVERLSAELDVPRVLASLLAQRGYHTSDSAKRFLRPSLDSLHNPFLLRDMDRAVEIISRAVASGESILIHGDYDVDGQCATALLTRTLTLAGAKVFPFVPHRLRDGYDFGPAGIAEAQRVGASTIITCDCGITAHKAVAAARKAGFRVIVTDHHLPIELPDADAVVNPMRQDCEYPCKDLCGTGVAFKLAQALMGELSVPENSQYHFLDLIALATVADIVPLRDENRVMVHHGLKLLARSRWPGIRALLQSAGVTGNSVTAGQVGFIVAPRLNAVGRIADAKAGLELLLTDNEREAAIGAEKLERLNTERQTIDQRTLEQAIQMVDDEVDLSSEYGIVLADEEWHPGVIGIVASRLVERYVRPVVLIALDGEEGKGSGRSISAFDLYGALSQCGELLDRFGGHRMAAGLSVKRGLIDRLRERFVAIAGRELTEEDLVRTPHVDLLVSLREADDTLERLLRHMQPCGTGNATPVLGVTGVHALGQRTLSGRHLKFVLEDGSNRLQAIGFNWADRMPEGVLGGAIDVAFHLDRNEWRGRSELQAKIVDIVAAA